VRYGRAGAGGRAWALAVLAAAGLAACGPGLAPGDLAPEAPTVRDRQRLARHQIQYALAFRAKGRLEAAKRSLETALRAVPDHARAHRLLAVVLEDLGRMAEAERHRARADALDPPPPLPPDEPLDLPSGGVLVVLPPPEHPRGREVRVQGGWPGGEPMAFLMRRLATRLPRAEVVTADPASTDDVRALLRRLGARAVISLRVDRAYCGDSEKDGPFAVAWLRVAAAGPDGLAGPPEQVREVELVPRPAGCVRMAVARALEAALALPAVRSALGSEGDGAGGWSHRTVRQLFPGLSARIASHLERGRTRLATGRVHEALEAFQRAAAVDPSDPDVRAYLNEAELTLAMARELGGGGAGEPPARPAPGDLDPQLTAAQRSAAERLLAEERRRRDQLLAALLVLDSGGRLPPAQALAQLHSTPVAAPDGPGARLARRLTEVPLEVRDYLGPDGERLARYWIETASGTPVLRAEDTDGDGRTDRWEGFVAGVRRHVWEDRQGLGAPDLHMGFEADGSPARVEVDGNGDGASERVFRYEDGVLASESRDTDDDGVLDRVERFDAEGYVARREEDLDGDGKVDVRTFYERGRLVRRESANPDLLQDPED